MIPTKPVEWAIAAFAEKKNDDYDRYERYMVGDQPLQFASEKFRQAFGRRFSAFAYNRCRTVVDAYADRLQVAGFGAPEEGNESLADLAKDLWEENLMSVREGHVYADQLGLGDAYVIAELHPDSGKVQYWPNDPRLIRLHWDDEQPNTIDLAAKQWVDGDRRVRLNLYFRDRIEKYVAESGTAGLVAVGGSPVLTSAAAGRFEAYQPEGEPWPLPLNVDDTVPVFHFPNNGRTNSYGESELRSILPLQDGINKTLMDQFVAMELVSFPQRVILGLDTADDAQGQALVDAFAAGLTRILTIEDAQAKIAEFSATDIRQYIDVAEFLDKAISRVTKVPVHYLGMTGTFPSGAALRIAEGPFVAKVEDRQRSNGAVWADLQRYGLRLLKHDVDPGDLITNWESAASVSEDDRIDRVQRMVDAGYPFEAALRETGYDPDQIDKVLAERASEQDQQRRILDRGDVLPGFDAAA